MSLPVPSEQTNLTHPKYRADIDGLRAIAVLFVVGFHAFPDWLRGGFVGVDIFFVISGYLISSIIISNLSKNSFSFSEFYIRRINRIFPALIIILIVFYALCWFALIANEYKQLGKHIAGAAGFVSNFVLWNENGYFNNAADTKPLLHLWTLGIEEQFYLIWPLFLWFAWKLRFNLLAIVIIVAGISFYLNIRNVHSDTVATFYSPQTRFWELMIGSILAYFTSRNLRPSHLATQIFSSKSEKYGAKNTAQTIDTLVGNMQAFLGGFLIVIALLLVTEEKAYPGWWALLPTVGTCFIIAAGQHAWLNRKLLSPRIVVWFGLISYPLYLWHWPLLSLARILDSGTPSVGIRIAIVGVSTMLAWLTYMLIEKPIRYGTYRSFSAVALVGLMAVVGYVGYKTYKDEGLTFRTVTKINDSLKSGNIAWPIGILVNDCGLSVENKPLFEFCASDSRQTPQFAIIGDSKAVPLFKGLFLTSSQNGRWLLIGGAKWLRGTIYSPAVISKNEIYSAHQPVTKIAVDAILKNRNIKKVVLMVATRNLFNLKEGDLIRDLPGSKNYDAALEGLINTINPLVKAGKEVIIVIDNPTLANPQDCMRRITSIDFVNDFLPKSNPSCELKISRHLELSEQYRKLLAQVASIYSGSVKIFDTTKYMCDTEQGVCLPYRNGRSLYRETDHISDYAAVLIGKDLNNYLQRY
jgi:peptidoglycan/LPS O-acetylase OafA/YrhL